MVCCDYLLLAGDVVLGRLVGENERQDQKHCMPKIDRGGGLWWAGLRGHQKG